MWASHLGSPPQHRQEWDEQFQRGLSRQSKSALWRRAYSVWKLGFIKALGRNHPHGKVLFSWYMQRFAEAWNNSYLESCTSNLRMIKNIISYPAENLHSLLQSYLESCVSFSGWCPDWVLLSGVAPYLKQFVASLSASCWQHDVVFKLYGCDLV